MKPIRFAILLLLTVVSTKAGTLSGTVRDSQGAVISDAYVIVHWDSSGSNYLKDNLGIRQDIAAATDSSGHFTVELPPGYYDVFVGAAAFTPHCEKVRLKDKEAKKYDVKLTVSPVTLKELD
jgi:hypothetical protein